MSQLTSNNKSQDTVQRAPPENGAEQAGTQKKGSMAEQVAERVYQLMLKDARLERERRGGR
jgi:hypothetical protein